MLRGDARSRAGPLLASLGAVALVVGAPLVWLADDVFDRDRFVGHAVSTLDSAAVRAAVGEKVATAVLSVEPDLVAVRPAIVLVAEAMADTTVFRTALGQALGEAHDQLFSTDGSRVLVEVTEAGALLVSIAEVLDVELPASVDEVRAVLAEQTSSGVDSSTLRLAEDVRALAAVVPISGLILAVAGILLARDRRRALAVGAGALALGALAALLAATLVRVRLVGSVEDDVVAAALPDLVAPFERGLQRSLFLLLVVGAIGWAGASSLAPSAAERRAGVASALRTWSLRPANSTSGGLARAGALLVVAVALAFWSGSVGPVVAVVVAVALAVLAVRQVVLTVEVPSPGLLRWSLGAALSLLAVLAVTADRSVAAPPEPVSECNGHPELCDRRFDEVLLLGTHNAGSTAAEGFLFPYQELSVVEQLDAGARALLLDVWYGRPSERIPGLVLTDVGDAPTTAALRELVGDEGVARVAAVLEAAGRRPTVAREVENLYLCHGSCELGATPLATTLDEIDAWLDEHPGEVVVLFFEDHVEGSQVAEAMTVAGLAARVHEHLPDAEWPTLGEMVLDDERVVVLSEQGGPPPGWYLPAFDLVMDTPFRFPTVDSLLGADACVANRGPDDAGLFLVNHWVQPDGPVRPRDAERANAPDFLVERLTRCEEERGVRPTIVAVDFLGRGDAMAAVDRLNGVADG